MPSNERPMQRGRLRGSLLEVVMIFFGITLALWFENWNSERTERLDETALLVELRSNLEENRNQLYEDIETNRSLAANLEKLLSHLESRQPYSDELAGPLDTFRYWSSPYLTSSAYETLKSRGLDLITDVELRQQIVHLFDVEYASLANDYERSEWINFETSMTPQSLRHIRRLPDAPEPIDYNAMLDDPMFENAVRTTLKLRYFGIGKLEAAEVKTKETITAITQLIDSE